ERSGGDLDDGEFLLRDDHAGHDPATETVEIIAGLPVFSFNLDYALQHCSAPALWLSSATLLAPVGRNFSSCAMRVNLRISSLISTASFGRSSNSKISSAWRFFRIKNLLNSGIKILHSMLDIQRLQFPYIP